MTITGTVGTVLVAALVGCFQGQPSEKTPIHLVPDMDRQPKYQAQGEGPFFPDGAAMRQPVPGTVARGGLPEDDAYHSGMNADGTPLRQNPVPVNMSVLQRGREQFNVYCAPCHGQVGDGQGIMVKYGYVPPPTFHSERIRDLSDGEIFKTISDGIRNMPAYRTQIPVADRWAIIAYFRALQRSQNASLHDVPEEIQQRLR